MERKSLKLEEIDKNMAVASSISREGLEFYSFEQEPFRIYGGLTRGDDGRLYRLPKEVAEGTSQGVLTLCTNTSGGRVKFRSNSTKVAIIAKYHSVGIKPHIPMTGFAGLDLFSENTFLGGFMPPAIIENNAYESIITIPGEKVERELTVNLPLYADLIDLYIGLEAGATLSAPAPYKHERPIVYYGSSITQGACASRPGACYMSLLSRMLDSDFINLGFSGSARGTGAIVDYIASLDMSVLVCDYDYNAPTPEHLEATHLPMYRKIRSAKPDLPIIFMTRPTRTLEEDRLLRRAVIKKTYDTAVAEGDGNVYFLDPTEHMPFMADAGTVDGVHPTDLGFYFMATALYPILEKLI